MAGIRFSSRRIRRLFLSPAGKVVGVSLILIVSIRFVILYNYDDTPPIRAPRPTASVEDSGIDWSKLYYVQYVTSPENLCNALMIWSEIEEIGSRAQRVMLYPSNWPVDEVDETDVTQALTPTARLLQAAAKEYYVKLRPLEVLQQNGTAQRRWVDSYTKMLAFNLTEFHRVLVIDSASVVRQNLDELFLLPAAHLAMPHVYWGEPHGWEHSSQMMLIQPSTEEFSKVETAVRNAQKDESDLDLINNLYKSKVMSIPQRPFGLLTGEFRRKAHRHYLGSSSAVWDPDSILQEAKFLHFSDWPVPKPWIRAPKELLNKHMPKCWQSEWFGASDCRDRTLWLKLYYDFAQNRKAVCGGGFELQSQELPPDSIHEHGRWFHPDEVG